LCFCLQSLPFGDDKDNRFGHLVDLLV
jgi:hypothetical protein